MANYSYVVPVYFNPLSFDDMMKPMDRLTKLSDSMDEQYVTLKEKAGQFKYLSQDMPENSEARKIYEGYSKDLEKQANNLIQHGVNFDTRNGLLDLRGRYSGEIGMLDEAKKKLEEEQKLRRQEYGKDSTVMYGKDNLTIDDFIKGRNPNLFRVSGNELYASGVSLAKAFSSRMTSASDEGKILNDYYNDWKETTGMSQASL